MLMLRDEIRGWRFYDQPEHGCRRAGAEAQIGTYTPVLGHDGADLAAAVQRSSRSATARR
jgi:predicted ATPase